MLFRLDIESVEDFFLAGENAQAGVYQRQNVREDIRITLEKDGILPASFDGRVACYRPIYTWGEDKPVTSLKIG